MKIFPTGSRPSLKERLETVAGTALLGVIAVIALTVILVRGMWIDAMDHRRTKLDKRNNEH